MTEEKEDALLIPRDQYLAAGIHIGTQIKTQDMVPFIYRITRAGLYVIDIRQTDARMRIAAKMIARFDPEKIVIVSARRYGHNPIQQFAQIIGGHAIPGRFIPGTLTNPNARSFLECDLLVIADPRADRQALKEAKIAKIPVVSFCDTDNNLGNIDLCVPANNRGRKALALIFWLLSRHVLLERGEIARLEDFNIEASNFQSRALISFAPTGDRKKILDQLKEKEPEAEAEEKPEEAPEEEPEEISEEKPEEEPVTIPEEKPVEKLEKPPEEEPKEPPAEKPKEVPKGLAEAKVAEEVEGKVVRPEVPEGEYVQPEDLIEGPLPQVKPKEESKKAAKKKAKKKGRKKKAKKSKKKKTEPEEETKE
ncbi:MAG: 30S ribosomal protein S2 [Candidatus Helarchaeota archaeon]|nr:30S ribosomal protein S2 [Candidatus Helarchaeota archaeon]